MTSKEIRQKFLDFFAKRGHEIIPAAPLVLAGDSTTLFTSSGMQPLVPYLLGEPHPSGSKRLVDSQPCLRLQDFDEVGDNRHSTFFEMLGNWSLGDYFKAEQLPWVWEFFTKDLGLTKNRLWVSVFEGDKSTGVPRDEESFAIWKSLGISEERIVFYGVKKNWWSRSGAPEAMPPLEIGGPDSEVFYEFIDIAHDPAFGDRCHPNCECGRFLEIGNSVFIQYQKQVDGSLKELSQRNVDFGGGLERLTAVLNNDPDMFKTDLFLPLIKILERLSGKEYGKEPGTNRAMRIIADHIRAAVMLCKDGILPSNKAHGYILRRFLRRIMLYAKKLGLPESALYFDDLIFQVAMAYEGVFDNLRGREKEISSVFLEESKKFSQALERGSKEIEKIEKIDGKSAFYLFESFGFPLELIEEIAKERGEDFSFSKKEFQEEMEKHQQLSRTAASGMFKGGLADQSEKVAKLHTATHLLHSALRKALGESVKQEGSNITAERLRFDFSHPGKLTSEEIKAIEDLVNNVIKKDLPVSFEIMPKDEALKSGAMAFFSEKYGNEVKVYSIGHSKSSGQVFSKEICAGPHVDSTKGLGRFKIIKEEAVGQGIRRIKAILANG